MAYAWVEIKHDGNIIRVGEEVDKSRFSDSEYKTLMSNGTIRDEPYPKGIAPYESVRTFKVRQAKQEYDKAVAADTSFLENKGDDSDRKDKPSWLGGGGNN